MSLFLMQASRNLSDAWLAHWIKSVNQSSVAQSMPVNITVESEILDAPTFSSSYIFNHAMCFLRKIVIFANLTECSQPEHLTHIESTNFTETQKLNIEAIETENSYYLAIYIAIAIFNALIALVRAFAFAYAGIKAAKLIHNRLLHSVIYVSMNASIAPISLFVLAMKCFLLFSYSFRNRRSSVSLTLRQWGGF